MGSHTDSSGLWCGPGARWGLLLALSLIEGWDEDKAWLTPLVRPHTCRELGLTGRQKEQTPS